MTDKQDKIIKLIDCHISKKADSTWFVPTDEVATFKKFEKEFREFDLSEAGTVVIDDVGLLRKYAGEVYKYVHNKKTVPVELGWGWANDQIRHYVLGAMNACTAQAKTCVITTTMKDNYVVVNGESAKAGTIPDVIRDIVANIDYQVELKTENGRYMAQVIKSPRGSMTLDMTKKSLWEVL